MTPRAKSTLALAAALLSSLLLASRAIAAGGDPLPLPEATPGATPDAGVRAYNRGLALAGSGDFAAAEGAYRQAVAANPGLAEAWNGLGHALKKQRRFPESLAAYDEALRLRPDYPLALQYLGELYVDMGEVDRARRIQAKLWQIDRDHAETLGAAIVAGSGVW